MKEIENRITIAADIDSVWKMIANLDKWPQWNQNVESISGAPVFGQYIRITMKGENCENHCYKAQIIELTPPYKIRWRARMLFHFLFSNERSIELKQNEDFVEVHVTERYRGLLLPLFWKKIEGFARGDLTQLLKGLKSVLETP